MADLSSESDQTFVSYASPGRPPIRVVELQGRCFREEINEPKTGVVGILFGLGHGAVSGPISQFQNVEFGRDGMLKLKDINDRLSNRLDPNLVLKTLIRIGTIWRQPIKGTSLG